MILRPNQNVPPPHGLPPFFDATGLRMLPLTMAEHHGFQFFAAIPFGLTADELFEWVQYGGGQELWDALSGQFNIKSLLCANTGCQMGGWFNNEIASPEPPLRLCCIGYVRRCRPKKTSLNLLALPILAYLSADFARWEIGGVDVRGLK
jgi:hypothetical protein